MKRTIVCIGGVLALGGLFILLAPQRGERARSPGMERRSLVHTDAAGKSALGDPPPKHEHSSSRIDENTGPVRKWVESLPVKDLVMVGKHFSESLWATVYRDKQRQLWIFVKFKDPKILSFGTTVESRKHGGFAVNDGINHLDPEWYDRERRKRSAALPRPRSENDTVTVMSVYFLPKNVPDDLIYTIAWEGGKVEIPLQKLASGESKGVQSDGADSQ